uniref:7TM GPCR serpentine receptor class x (Srx) domain-containing protein n=1 Tax=Ditylenchus dipsaci TaxID=166011 RepID=A0A915ET66_9BILA
MVKKSSIQFFETTILVLHQINCWISVVFGISLNTLLLWLIWKRSSKEMHVYRAILQQACLIDIWLLFISSGIQIIYTSYTYNFAIYSVKWALACGCVVILQTVSYTIIITCGLKIKRYVKNSNIDPGAKGDQTGGKRMAQVNKELNIILFLAEFSLSVVCIVTTFVWTDSSSSIGLFGSYLTLPIYWMATINPLITISVVKTYRNFFRSSKKIVSTTANSVTGFLKV